MSLSVTMPSSMAAYPRALINKMGDTELTTPSQHEYRGCGQFGEESFKARG